MTTKMTTEKEQAAIADGYWFSKDHDRWFVGRGNARLPGDPVSSRLAARKAMVAAWEASRKAVPTCATCGTEGVEDDAACETCIDFGGGQ